MTKTFHRAASVLCLSLLSACAGLPTEPDEVAAPLPVSENTAVIALVENAHMSLASGKSETAGAALERALRIEPRNPRVWHELAKLRLSEGDYRQAAALAAKSNTWAGNDKRLRAMNWRVIGDARVRLGNFVGANAAYDKAAELEQ